MLIYACLEFFGPITEYKLDHKTMIEIEDEKERGQIISKLCKSDFDTFKK